MRGSAVCGGRRRHRLAALLEDVVAVPRQQLEIALRQSQPELLGIAMHPDVDERLALGEMGDLVAGDDRQPRSEEHTSELQSLMRISYAVFCLKKKKTHTSKS